jgi:hypothetical protein
VGCAKFVEKMEANELRIGNIINYSNKKYTYWVDELIGQTDIVTKETYNMVHSGELMEYEPIPLTEEWLVKLDFAVFLIKKKYTIICKFGEPNNRINATKNGFYYKVYNGTIKINYVHQLQNLYFALTGKELTNAS